MYFICIHGKAPGGESKCICVVTMTESMAQDFCQTYHTINRGVLQESVAYKLAENKPFVLEDSVNGHYVIIPQNYGQFLVTIKQEEETKK